MSNEELELLSDSKYRQFISAVEKALKSFEYSSEWADLISALGKLSKVLQGHTKFKVVPRKLRIGKRLAQCMHPALPSGVHLKALETYDLIFKRIGTKGLAQDLFIYSAGILPLLGNAAMPVKPVLLGIYESYFLGLGKALLPGLPGVVLGLLPGIEEGSEYTERTISLLESLSQSTNLLTFYSTLWRCIVLSSSVRLPAITFILLQLNKKGTGNQDSTLLGGDLPVMVQAVCDCLGDSSVLVQRSVLDFMLVTLPSHTSVISSSQKSNLASAALGVLLRRDMSLNRRLYTWVLGPNDKDTSSLSRTDSIDEPGNPTDTYFDLNSKALVIEGIKSLFRQQCILGSGGKKAQRLEVLKPFRILINLLDKPEIGGPILEEVLLEVFRSLHVRFRALQENGHTSEERPRNDSLESIVSVKVTDVGPGNEASKTKLVDELVKTANLLFNAFEPFFLWEYFAKLLFASKTTPNARHSSTGDAEGEEGAENGLSADCSEIFLLMDFILDVAALEAEIEVQTEHWPELLRQIAVQLTVRCEMMSLNEVKDGICLCSKLLSKVMPSMKAPGKTRSSSVQMKDSVSSDRDETTERKEDGDGLPATDVAVAGGEDLEDWDVIDFRTRRRRKKRSKQSGSAAVSPKPSKKVTDREAAGEVASENAGDVAPVREDEGNGDEVTVEKQQVKGEEEGKKCEDATNADHGPNDERLQAGNQRTAVENDRSEGEVDTELNEWGDFGGTSRLTEETKAESSNTRTQIGNEDRSERPWENSGMATGHESGDEFMEASLGTNVPQPTLIQSCACDFQKFFAKFVEERILAMTSPPSSPENPNLRTERANSEIAPHLNTDRLLNEDLLSPRPAAQQERSLVASEARIELKALMCDRVKRKKSANSAKFPAVTTEPRLGAEAFAAACKLLVEFSCFPVYCGSDWTSGSPDNGEDPSVPKLPAWLQTLLACCFEAEEFDIQSSAVGTLLDLINLTLSVTSPGVATRPKANTAVVVIPMISQHSLELIERSVVYEEIAKSLWGRLREDTTLYHQRVVELFLQLHNLTSAPSLCTNVIGNSLVDTRKELSLSGHWKFAVFWHVARDVEVQDSGRSRRLGEVRTLDRALFVMLDSLQSEEPSVRVLTQHWIAHALQHGDLGRIIDPLLLLLLHPATARVSVHYASFSRVKRAAVPEAQDRANEKPQPRRPDKGGGTEPEPGVGDQSGPTRRGDVSDTLNSDVTGDDSGQDESADSTEDEADDEKTDDEAVKQDQKPRTAPQNPAKDQATVKKKATVHPLDQHKLLYHLVFDSQLTLYAFNTLMSILSNAPGQFVCAAATTSISASNTPHQEKIKELLIRHRRSLLGKEFYGPLYDSYVSSPNRNSRLFGGPLTYLRPTSSKYLEILVSIALYFVRSEYPEHVKVTHGDTEGSVQVQMASVDLLTSIVWQLVDVVKENGASFGTYISDMFSRCKVQKALLHCLVSTLYYRTGSSAASAQSDTESAEFAANPASGPSEDRTFQVKLLRLLQAIFILEDCIFVAESYASESAGALNASTKAEAPAETSSESKSNQSGQRFVAGKLLASQSMLVSAVLHGLRYDDVDMHREWLQFVITCLPHMQHELGTWVVPVTEHVCHILERATGFYTKEKQSQKGGNTRMAESSGDSRPSLSNIPPDYMLTLLGSLTSLCHFCLLDSASKSGPVLSLQPRVVRSSSSGASAPGEAGRSSGNSLQIFTNLMHAFSVQSAPVSDVASIEGPRPILEARESMLSILPTLLTTLFNVWKTWDPTTAVTSVQRLPSECPLNLIGDPKTVRHHILQLLTPIAMHHTIVFLASLANVWCQRTKREGSAASYKAPRPRAVVSEEQVIVVDIVCAIKALSLVKIIDTVKQILRQVITSKEKTTPMQTGLEVNILQFLYEYLQRATQSQLVSVRAAHTSLMKEGLQLSFPPALFMLVVILQSYVQRLPLQEDRRVRKELQDITQRLIEAVNTVAGSSLENAAWFRRSMAVIHQPEGAASDQSSNFDSEISEAEPAPAPPVAASGSNSSNFSTQALCVLSDVLAPLLDIVFGTEEKDKMTNLLVTVMYNVTPYLKNHSPLNMPRFRACSALLASLSGYQYTRRAWKKDVIELLMDTCFFQMDITCMESWCAIIDNLMTQDNTSFRDLMARVAAFSQSTSINIFANREQEMEQRAQLLKKLSFVIFCSEAEQYQASLPEIQERLTECLRLPQAPVLHEQVFLCFRVLLLRMSPQKLTSLWPVIIAEIVHVLLQLESDLSADGKSQSQRMVISELLLGTNGSYVSYKQEKWLGLYLAACKALDLALALPGDSLPQFQMYRWAFEGEAYNLNIDGEKLSVFRPHIARLCKLLKKRTRNSDEAIEDLQRVPGRPLLTMYQIKSLEQLLPFFHCLSNKKDPTELRDKVSKPKTSQGRSLLERVVERDFLEPLLAD